MDSTPKTQCNEKDQAKDKSSRITKYLSKCIINIANFLERAKGYDYLIKEDGLLEDLHELQMFAKKMMSVFVVYKRTRKICRFRKDPVI